MRTVVSSSASLIVLFSCAAAADVGLATNQFLPPRPAHLWDVALIQSSQYTRPYLPALRTSNDGRIGLSVKSRGSNLAFYLIAPEKLQTDFHLSPRGASMLSSTSPYRVTGASFHASNRDGELANHSTICDPSAQFPTTSVEGNPATCGPDGKDDCYKLTVISFYRYTLGDSVYHEIWGTPIRVRIGNPKTSSALIREITPGTPVQGPSLPLGAVFEPMVTEDGRLLVLRSANSVMSWFNERIGATLKGSYDILYAAYTADRAPCDVTQWANVKPITHAPYDSLLTGRYGIAAQPFRDAAGTLIPDGVDLPGTYPWLDRKGNNLFFTTTRQPLYFIDPYDSRIKSQYKATCVSGVPCIETPASEADIASFEAPAPTQGLSVMGHWTNGKVVMLDNLLNNTEYGLNQRDEAHRMLKLYSDDTGWVRTGTGRDNGGEGSPPGSILNTTIVDSIQNLFNYNERLKPRTPRDVVWLVSSGKVSTELVFDDYVNPDGFLIAEMQVALNTVGTNANYRFQYANGFRSSQAAAAGFNDPVLLQNSATAPSSRWRIPAAGELVGRGRVEPVALGGIHGKGLYLQSTSALRFQVAQQPSDPLDHSWYVGVFLDPRFLDDGIRRELISFPDRTGVELVGLRQLVFRADSGAVAGSYALPPDLRLKRGAYAHIGLQILRGGSEVQIFLNGFLFRVWSTADSNVALFRMVPGTMYLGDSPYSANRGLAGWVDELKVLAEAPNYEVICNHARGTLVGLEEIYEGPLRSRAESSPVSAHTFIGDEVYSSSGYDHAYYACYTDYQSEMGASHLRTPPFTDSVRAEMIFPEGPLVFGEPRPDSSNNQFCRSCHTAGSSRGLGLGALTLDSNLLMQDDRRRQPLQPLRLLFGNMPTAVLGEDGPAAALSSGADGIALDQWLFPKGE